MFPFRFQNFWCKYHKVDTIVRETVREGLICLKLCEKPKPSTMMLKIEQESNLEIFMNKLMKNLEKIEYVQKG